MSIADVLFDPIGLSLRDCLCRELTRTRSGPVCRCYYTHSQAPPTDDGCTCGCEHLVDGKYEHGNGDGRVRLVSAVPDFGGQNQQAGPTPQSCPPGWIASFELSTSRCIPTSDEVEPLPDHELTDMTLRLGDDRAALIRVLSCCDALTDRDVLVELLQPIGPQGACAGWALTVQVAVPGGPEGPC